MKAWRETRWDAGLDQCPCCLGPANGRPCACQKCWASHSATLHGTTNLACRIEIAAIGDRLYATALVWGVWCGGHWIDIPGAFAAVNREQAERLAEIERAKPMAHDLTFEVRRRIPAPEIATKPAEDEKVWGVWLTPIGDGSPMWVNGDYDPWVGTRAMAEMDARRARTYFRAEARRLDDPRCAIPGSSQQYATAVACATPSPIPSGSILVARDGKLVAEQPPPPLDAIPLADLARALFDADETVAAFLDTKSEGDPERRARNLETAWARDEGGAKTRVLVTVERIRASRRKS